ncbi:MAG: prepilin-type N-terminal cleavage/methylation domain-containing protein [Longimicrobiales bacterium]|nr:prepilin-type N-terminal cleavage/methylation domain-containing protein [Longimicrobiales bacterium]
MQNRKGFTLIELLIVVVIIGILAAIALPKFGQTRERAYYTTMTADLTNLRSAQEMYYQTTGNFSYASDLTVLGFAASNGVNLTITGADNLAWAATATHNALGTSLGCAIAYGDIANSAVSYPSTPGGTAVTTQTEGRPICDG